MSDVQDVFEEIKKARGDVANIYKAFSGFPDAVKSFYHFYTDVMLSNEGPLNRIEREWLAVQTSCRNETAYCIQHHEEAFEVAQQEAPSGLQLNDGRKEILSVLAKELTERPYDYDIEGLRRRFNEAGYDDRQFQHAVLVISFFNLANRIVSGLGVELEDGFEKTCK